MYELVASQVFGIDGLVNLSNIVFLVAFSSRDVLKLRILSLLGEVVITPYYYLQHEILWAPLIWSGAFMAVNAVRIVTTALERRPVVLSEKEAQLYHMAFTTIEKILEIDQPCPMGRLFARGDHPQKGRADL
jgi:hypothetical protein